MRAIGRALALSVLLFLALAVGIPGSPSATSSEWKVNDDEIHFSRWGNKIAMNETGYAVFTWFDNRNSRLDVYAQIYGARGFAVKSNFQVNPDGRRADYPDVAIDAQGNFVIVWLTDDDTLCTLYAQRFAANGSRLGQPIQVYETAAGLGVPCIAMDINGNFVVAWSAEMPDGRHDILMRRFDANGEPIDGPRTVNSETAKDQVWACVDMTVDGRFVIAWNDRNCTPQEVIAQCFGADGQPVGGNIQISQHPAGVTADFSFPGVAIQPDGKFMVTWDSWPGGNIYAACLEFGGRFLTPTFTVSESPNQEHYPAICALPGERFGIFWKKIIGSAVTGHVGCYRSFDSAGQGDVERTIAAQPAAQQAHDIASSLDRGFIATWADDRNAHWDIWAYHEGPGTPLNLHAGSGFPGFIPLTWDAPYGRDDISKYRIFRSTGGAPLTEVALVDLKLRGVLGMNMRDWIDTSVEAGVPYSYAVAAAEGEDTCPCPAVTATATMNGPVLIVKATFSTPVIDGVIDPLEWSDAAAYAFDNPYALQPIFYYLKYNYPHLYLAVDDPNDTILDPVNGLGILFDLDHNGAWDPGRGSREGMITLYSNSAQFTGYWGTYPNALGADAVKPAAGIEKVFSCASGHMQYEVSIDLTTSPLTLRIGDCCGFAFYLADPGSYYPTHYGNAGEWPGISLWECARSLGGLCLEDVVLAGTEFWPMYGGDIDQSFYNVFESYLNPPFAYVRDYVTGLGHAGKLALAYNTLVGATTTVDPAGETSLFAIDAFNGNLIWRFTLPNSSASIISSPAVSDSIVVAASQGCAGLYGLDRRSGAQKWFVPGSHFAGSHPLIDRDQLYIAADSLYRLELSTGRTIWSVPANDKKIISLGQTYLYYASGTMLECRNRADGTVAWAMPNSGQVSTAVDAQFIYSFHNGSLVARNRSNGSIQWSYPMAGASASDAENRLLFSEDFLVVREPGTDPHSRIFVFKKSTGALVWQKTWDSTLVHQAVGANYAIYFRVEPSAQSVPAGKRNCLLGLNLISGDTVLYCQDQFSSDPIIANHQLWIGVDDRVRGYSNLVTKLNHDPATIIPSEWPVVQSYPNPFNSDTHIRYTVQRRGQISLQIYNVAGQLIKTLSDEIREPGIYEANWDARSESGAAVASGVYLVCLQGPFAVSIGKILLLR